ncbi:MAG: tryptophan-rich sensory protein [Synechococcales cyanobacterium C42_A2020_086]|jgi:hypothetical protein|nr:tryptophan-rich sensory protein [Synechococcales cyanobacterium C42_A2020_086]
MKSTASSLLRAGLTLAAILGTFAVNVWSNLFPLNGQSIGEISNTQFANVLIIPANYAFAIWGVIYLGLLAFGIYQLLPAQRRDPAVQSIQLWVIVTCIAQAVWVFLFLSRLFWLSVVAMLGILLPLIAIYQIAVVRQASHRLDSRQDRWLIQIPFSIYLGWISVATIVNVACALDSGGWTGGGIPAPVWTVLLLVIAAAIAATLAWRYRDAAYSLVIIWAAVAVAVRQSSFPLIVTVALGLAAALAILLGLQRLLIHRHSRR